MNPLALTTIALSSLMVFSLAPAARSQNAIPPEDTATNLPESVSVSAEDLNVPVDATNASDLFGEQLRPAPVTPTPSSENVDPTPGFERARTDFDEDPDAHLVRWQLGQQEGEAMGVEVWF